MLSQNQLRTIYIAGDFAATNVAWLLFNIVRYAMLGMGFGSLRAYLTSTVVAVGQVAFPLLMLTVYALSGYYNMVYRKSRVEELMSTFTTTLIGAVVIFFAVLLNDMSDDRAHDYALFGIMFALLFGAVYIARVCVTMAVRRRILSGRWGFDTIIIGVGDEARRLASHQPTMRSMGFRVCGFVDPSGDPAVSRTDCCGLPVIPLASLESYMEREGRSVCNFVVIPPPGATTESTLHIINRLFSYECPVYVRPDAGNVVLTPARTRSVVAEPLIDITRSEMPQSTLNIKRVSDVVVSSVALILLAPLIGALAVAVRLDSPGPAFYRQRRIGYHRRPFDIVKLRTMRTDAEAAGPALSHGASDPRITRMGRIMRKYRLDELPQFWNVVRGDMSIVGPRPEREHYIRRIMQRAPAYALLHSLRPGITSWGMVKYGYASDVGQMIERMQYDLLYLENVSFSVDMKIIIYTITTVIKGTGQ